MAYNLAEVLEEHIGCIGNRKDLGSYVSDKFTNSYPCLSPAIYGLKRDITIIPENSEEVLQRFYLDMNVEKNDGIVPKTNITLPLIIETGYEEKTKQVECEGTTTVEYELHFNEILQKDESFRRTDEKKLTIFVPHNMQRYIDARCQYGKQEIALSIKGIWTYEGKVESISVNIPAIPEKMMDLAAEAQLKYFQILTEAKTKKFFPGETLSQPELRFLWIPRKEDFKVKVHEMEIVKPDPALILRVNKKYDHVIGLWDTETEEPLEFLIKRHSLKAVE